MSEYLRINLLTLLFPLLFSFDRRVRFYRCFPAVAGSILLTGVLFVLWDVMATARGDWSFNARHVGDMRILGLPLEEILFFMTIPYSCLFIYENLRVRLEDRPLEIGRTGPWVVMATLAWGSVSFWSQPYTGTVLAVCAFLVGLYFALDPGMLASRNFWVFCAVTYVPFFIVNHRLTSLPVVQYRPGAIWGVRITTIPLEDFFYSFAMLSLNVFFYRLLSRRYGATYRPTTRLREL